MDTGRLPAYRSSYLLRFHPYPRVKPSVRERIMVSPLEDRQRQVDTVYLESDISFTLDHAIHGFSTHDETQTRQRRLSISSLVIDLALLYMKRASSDEE